ncbi:hypothetical protein JB92DRAFT_3263769 [Gautieria morchelliformis]|nr:hypothetical protein JB92DRAFT_3263769 [Gautieria morchelliformis]
MHSPGPRPASPSGTHTAGGGFTSVYTAHHAAGSGYATNGRVFPPPAPMVPRSPPMVGVGTRSSPIKIEDMDNPTPDAEHDEGQGKAVSGARPTLRLLPKALRTNPTPGHLSGTTFPLSDADWEQMTSVALTGTNKQRPEGGLIHVDVQRELEALIGTLPCKKSCDRIWACYMYDTFWAFKTNAERVSCTPIAWLALLLIVTSHGLATMKPVDAKTFGIAKDTDHWRMSVEARPPTPPSQHGTRETTMPVVVDLHTVECIVGRVKRGNEWGSDFA